MHHDIKKTWLLVRYTRDKKKVLVNLYWLLKERYFVLMISDIHLPREMELSNGNIIITDNADLDIIDCTKQYNIRLKFTGIDIILAASQFYYFTWRYATPNSRYLTDKYITEIDVDTEYNTISTDFDSEVNKLNSRMSLIGADNTVCTDGIQIIEKANDIQNKNSMKQNTIYTDVCKVKEDIKCEVTDGGFVHLNLVECCTCKLEADERVNLRFIDGAQYTSVFTDDNIYCDGIFRAMITHDMLTRTKRVLDCMYVVDNIEERDIYFDFSNLDLIDKFRIHDKNHTVRSVILDFKDKYVMMESHGLKIHCRDNTDIIIKYSNKEMQKMIEMALGMECKYRMIYTGE